MFFKFLFLLSHSENTHMTTAFAGVSSLLLPRFPSPCLFTKTLDASKTTLSTHIGSTEAVLGCSDTIFSVHLERIFILYQPFNKFTLEEGPLKSAVTWGKHEIHLTIMVSTENGIVRESSSVLTWETSSLLDHWLFLHVFPSADLQMQTTALLLVTAGRKEGQRERGSQYFGQP